MSMGGGTSQSSSASESVNQSVRDASSFGIGTGQSTSGSYVDPTQQPFLTGLYGNASALAGQTPAALGGIQNRNAIALP